MAVKGKAFFKAQGFSFDLPAGWNLLAMAEPKEVPAMAAVGAAVRGLLARPIGMVPLAEVIKGLPHKKVVIISEDQTRPTPVSKILMPLLAELNRMGIGDGDIDLIIGTGTHVHPNASQMRAKLGEEAVSRLRVSIHNPDAADLVSVGTTSRGTQVKVNRLVAEAALVLAIGTINPHYFAGYGGGPKIMLPGVSSRETIKQNHVWIRDPMTDSGITEGNPIWEDMLEAARLEGLAMKFDALINSRGEIYQLFGGEVAAAQRAAMAALKEVYGVAVPALADVTITSAYPLESDLIQSGKSILLANQITKQGGTIILVSSCPDGAGPLMYETLKEHPDPMEVIQWIAEGKASPTGGPMASRLRQLVRTKSLIVVTDGLSQEKLADMEFGWAPTVEAAIAQVAAGRPQCDAIVLPIGGSTFPYLAKTPAAVG